ENVQTVATQQFAPGELDEVIAAIRAGVAYVNVHSNLSPGGQIREQIRANRRDKDKDKDRGGGAETLPRRSSTPPGRMPGMQDPNSRTGCGPRSAHVSRPGRRR